MHCVRIVLILSYTSLNKDSVNILKDMMTEFTAGFCRIIKSY